MFSSCVSNLFKFLSHGFVGVNLKFNMKCINVLLYIADRFFESLVLVALFPRCHFALGISLVLSVSKSNGVIDLPKENDLMVSGYLDI